MKILYLEDNKTDADLTKRQLAKDIPDCKLNIISSIEEAKKQLSIHKDYDIALIDIQLPDGSGLDLLVEIKQQDLPVATIVLTGSGDIESAVAALKAGAEDYLVKKPGYLKILSSTIESVLINCKANLNQNRKLIKVIYAEHNNTDIEFTKNHMSRYAPHIQMEICRNGEELLNILENKNKISDNYDVILTDYRLDGIDGLEIIKTVRQIKQMPVAIVMVTGQENEEIAIQALRLGADEYLVKRTNYLFRLPSLITSAYQRYELERNQVQLKKSEERFRRLAENAQDIIYRFEILPVSLVSYISPAVTKITGYTPDEFYTDRDLRFNIVHPEDRNLLDYFIHTPYRSLTLRWIRKNGETIWIEQRDSPVFNENDDLVAVEGIARDITLEKQMEEALKASELQYRLLADHSGDVIFVLDMDLRYKYVSPATKTLRGYEPEEVLNQSLKDVLTPESFEIAFKALNEELKPLVEKENYKDESRSLELEVIRKDGSKVWTEVKVSLMTDENNVPTGIIGLTRDISQRKKAEAELIKAKEKAEESDRLKTAFLTNMSHEIRTPMNGIIGFTQILKQTRADSKKREEYLDIINSSCERLLAVVDDIIDISKIESGIVEVYIENTNINYLLKELYDFHSKTCQNKNLYLTVKQGLSDDEAFISTDEIKLHQILTNLLNNAIKFTTNGGITISYTQRDNWLEFSVKDTGIGIRGEDTGFIFDRFRQADSNSTRKYGGTGLGLSISQAFVNKLGGEIWVESKPGEGSVFYFTIPYCPPKKQPVKPQKNKSLESFTWPGKKILVAEDDNNNYNLIKEILGNTQSVIYHAVDGAETVKKYYEIIPDIILMDIKMPGKDGYEALKIIRNIDKRIPVIALTAYAYEQDRINALQAGFNGYLSKPLNINELFEIIDVHLK